MAQPHPQFPFVLGVDNGRVYTIIEGDYVETTLGVPQEGCIHLSVVYAPEEIRFYLNGSLEYSVQHNLNIAQTVRNFEPFFIGQHYPSRATTFSGVINQVRVFTDVRTDSEISSLIFSTISKTEDAKHFYFNFEIIASGITVDLHHHYNIGYLGKTMGTYQEDGPYESEYAPEIVEDDCVQLLEEPESIGGICSSLPNCTPPVAPNDILCNGDFEQYCTALNGTQPAWATPDLVFNYTASNGVIGSDVVNWNNYDVASGNFNASIWGTWFFVRNGIGSQTGFNPLIMPQFGWFPGANAIVWPPTDTWNGQGNGVAAISELSGLPNNLQEGLAVGLRSDLLPNTHYDFSGWCYMGCLASYAILNGCSSSSTAPAGIRVGFAQSGVSGSLYQPLNLQVQHSNTVGTTNNGWVRVSGTFRTPTNLGTGFDHMVITADASQISDDLMIFFDDLELLEITEDFPQYFNVSQGSDSWNKRIKVDQQDNVYVLQTIRGPEKLDIKFELPVSHTLNTGNSTEGSVMAKYDKVGRLLWQQYYPHVAFNDFEIDPNGDIFAVGAVQPLPMDLQLNGSGANTTLNIINNGFSSTLGWSNIYYELPQASLNPVPYTYIHEYYDNNDPPNKYTKSITGNVNFQACHTVQLAIGRISSQDGSVMNGIISPSGTNKIEAFGGMGSESGVNVKIEGGKAYVTAEIDSINYYLCPEAICTTQVAPPALPHPGEIDWGGSKNDNTVLTYDFSSNARNHFNVYTFNRITHPGATVPQDNFFQGLDIMNNNLYVLSKDQIQKVDVNTGASVASVWLPSNLTTNSIRPRNVKFGSGGIYITYRSGANQTPNLIEQRSSSDLSLINSSNANEPIGLETDGHDVYVTHRKFNTAGTEIFAIEKLSSLNGANPFTNVIWDKQSNGNNIEYYDFKSNGDYLVADIVKYNNDTKLAFIGDFETTASNWNFDFDAKSISSNNGPIAHNVFVGTIVDDGSTASFKRALGTEKKQSSTVQVYPNPAQGNLVVESESTIKMVRVTSIKGKTILVKENILSNVVELELMNASSGMYFILVEDETTTHVRKLLLK